MNLRHGIVAIVFASITGAAFAAEANNFDLMHAGKKSGSTAYTVQKNKDGQKVHSTVDYLADGPGGSLYIDYRINLDGLAVGSTLSKPQESQLTFYTPSKAHDTLTVSTKVRGTDQGQPMTLTLPKPDFLIALGDDTSIWQSLLNVAATKPHPDKLYTLLMNATPAKAGSKYRIEHLRLNPPSESAGTLDGKPVTLQHFVVNFAGGTAHLYADAEGTLMQAELTPFGMTHVRKNFALDTTK